MQIGIEPAGEETQQELASWRYPPPYDFYDGDAEPVLNPERFFAARDERGDLIGFYYFEEKPPDLDYGLGLRPDLTGRGLGLEFFLAGLAFGRERYRPRRVCLHVAEFNERARRVYERAGFAVVSSHVRSFERFGDVRFLTMAEAAGAHDRDVRELRNGLWHWQAPHPEWSPNQYWPQVVSSYALDDGEQLLLFDPLAVPDELLERAAERRPVVVLTAPWHERDAQRLVDLLGAPVFVPPPDTRHDLMRKYGVTAEQAGDGSPDVRWLLAEGGGEAHLYAAGERLPFGVEAFPGREHNDLVLWIERFGAVLSGDTLADFGRGLELPAEWLRPGVTREQVAAGLRPLLKRQVELVLPTHGAPTDRAALERALA